jgi:hypothetical protein
MVKRILSGILVTALLIGSFSLFSSVEARVVKNCKQITQASPGEGGNQSYSSCP